VIKDNDVVCFDNNPVLVSGEYIYILLNKPKGVVTTCDDEKGRKTVLDLIDKRELEGKRIFPVGRLDYDTEGLLILTNDGDFTRKMTHPSSKVKKVYVATLDKNIIDEDLKTLEQGIEIEGEKTHPAMARNIKSNVVELTITQGRNRQVRKMFEALGYKVVYLKRIAVGRIRLGNLKTGEWRFISKEDIKKLC